MRLARSILLVLVLAGVPLGLTSAPAVASSASSRGAATLAATQAPQIPELVNVRAAHHPGFDRVVFELRGGKPSSRSVRYVSALTQDPSDEPIDIAGGAILQVVFQGANAHDESGATTVTPDDRFAPGLPSLKEVVPAGDFEAVVSYGLGIGHRVPFKVFELSNPSRVVIDISTTGSSSSAGGSGSTGTGSGGAGESPGSLPFTGVSTTGFLFTGLGLALTGLLVLALARKTRTP